MKLMSRYYSWHVDDTCEISYFYYSSYCVCWISLDPKVLKHDLQRDASNYCNKSDWFASSGSNGANFGCRPAGAGRGRATMRRYRSAPAPSARAYSASPMHAWYSCFRMLDTNGWIIVKSLPYGPENTRLCWKVKWKQKRRRKSVSKKVFQVSWYFKNC